jgi:transposase InsO family protein
MVWNGKTTMELRSEFVQLANQPGVNISQLCRQFEITRRTAYKWISRAQAGETCADRSRRPKYHPSTTASDVELLIVKARKKFPSWGGRKLHAWLARQGYRELPSPSTITAILRRNNLLNESISNNSKVWQRFEHERPNQLWQMDFKGHFAMAKGRCHPLTILDDCSRFSLALEACKNERRTTVEEKLQLIFKRYGLPERFNLDNGPPWGSSGTGSLTRLTVWLIRLGINVSYSRPFHPQTNGKDERFHRSLKTELLQYKFFYNISEAQIAFNKWRKIYNEERPHEALGLKVPLDCYKPSCRELPATLPSIEYGFEDMVRKVSYKGDIRFKNKRIFISEGLTDMPVALKLTTDEQKFDIYFCHHKIKRIDLRNYD